MQIIAQSHFSDFCLYWPCYVPDVSDQELGDNMAGIQRCSELTWLFYQNMSLKVYSLFFPIGKKQPLNPRKAIY